ncbi:unnamed protein product [Ambrosiozyma monospora]|uniref:Unnamed protein product n=1 Tax=Ambrosiozyma monospora TaxID=43982 RepID=A0A9W7DCK4_AMBMO|nr:unnamed protein product [Ambrosiozyma monospora]
MSVHNPNNWHWIDKNCLPWAKQYFENNLKGISTKTPEYEIMITEVKSVTGDCDVTQRKGKVKCLFELNVSFNAEVKKLGEDAKDDEKIIYEIVIPEFEHDYDDDDYNFQVKNGKLELKKTVRDNLIPEVLVVFKKFQPLLLSTHQPKLQHNTSA